jgi:hypothetical protein
MRKRKILDILNKGKNREKGISKMEATGVVDLQSALVSMRISLVSMRIRIQLFISRRILIHIRIQGANSDPCGSKSGSWSGFHFKFNFYMTDIFLSR